MAETRSTIMVMKNITRRTALKRGSAGLAGLTLLQSQILAEALRLGPEEEVIPWIDLPEPNPDRPLDFSGIMEDRASDPTAWPHPFAANGAERPILRQIGDEHAVRALPGVELGALQT